MQQGYGKRTKRWKRRCMQGIFEMSMMKEVRALMKKSWKVSRAENSKFPSRVSCRFFVESMGREAEMIKVRMLRRGKSRTDGTYFSLLFPCHSLRNPRSHRLVGIHSNV